MFSIDHFDAVIVVDNKSSHETMALSCGKEETSFLVELFQAVKTYLLEDLALYSNIFRVFLNLAEEFRFCFDWF